MRRLVAEDAGPRLVFICVKCPEAPHTSATAPVGKSDSLSKAEVCCAPPLPPSIAASTMSGADPVRMWAAASSGS